MSDFKKQIQRLCSEIKQSGYKKICFWIPAYNVGGGTYYYCKIARYLADNTDLDIYYMDFPDGYPTSLLEGSRITILDYSNEERDFCIQEPCIIFTNSTRVIQMKRMNPLTKILFWHYETVKCAWHLVLLRNEASRFIELTRDHNAMIFHDWSSRNAIERQFDMTFSPKYLYMFLDKKPTIAPSRPYVNEDEMNIVWVGRIAAEKVYSVMNIIDNLRKYKTTKKKRLHIIGEGWKMDFLKKYAYKFRNEIEFIFTGTIPKDQLDQYLIDHADIVFAMGLSAIESAALNLPSVVVQLDTKVINDEDFWWLYDTKEYCVGILPEQKADFDVQYTSFAEMMDEIYVNNNGAEIAKKCYDIYHSQFCGIEKIIINSLQFALDCTLTAKMIEECIRYMPYINICVSERKLLKWPLSEKVYFYDHVDYYDPHGNFKKRRRVKNSEN